MIRLALFDIDGTLVRTGGAGVKAFAQVFLEEFNAREGLEKLKFAGRTDTSLVREFFDLHKIPATPENFRRFFERYVFWLDQILALSDTSACEGVRDFLHALRSVPHPPMLGLLTGNIQLGAEIKLRHFDLWKEFETGAFADDSEDRNEIAAVALKRGRKLLGSHLRGTEVLVIGDTPRDIACGRAIGAKVLAVATGGATLEELKRHAPDWAVKNLEGIRAAEVCA